MSPERSSQGTNNVDTSIGQVQHLPLCYLPKKTKRDSWESVISHWQCGCSGGSKKNNKKNLLIWAAVFAHCFFVECLWVLVGQDKTFQDVKLIIIWLVLLHMVIFKCVKVICFILTFLQCLLYRVHNTLREPTFMY